MRERRETTGGMPHRKFLNLKAHQGYFPHFESRCARKEILISYWSVAFLKLLSIFILTTGLTNYCKAVHHVFIYILYTALGR